MCIVYHHGQVFRSAQCLQSSRCGLQPAYGDQSFFRLYAESDCSRIYREDVVCVVPACQPGPAFGAVYSQQHSVKTFLHDPAGVVGNAFARVCNDPGCSVLHHHSPVFVICVRDCKCIGRKHVEEQFLAAQVFGESLVIVKMVMREVGKDADLEFEASNPFLLHSYGAYFHEAVFASFIHHSGEQGVYGNRVRSGVYGFVLPFTYIVRYGGQKSAVISQAGKQPVEKGDGRGFSVCSRYADQGELFRWTPVEIGRYDGKGMSGRSGLYENMSLFQ